MDTPPRKKRGIFLGALIIVLILAIGGVAATWFLRDKSEKPEPSKPHPVEALGRLQPKSGVISIGIPLVDQLEKLEVSEGQRVERSQKLAVLASHTERKAALTLAKAQLQDAQMRKTAAREAFEKQQADAHASDEVARATELPMIDAQKSQVKLLEANRNQAKLNLDRVKNALEREAAPKQEFEQAELLLQKAQAELDAAEVQRIQLETAKNEGTRQSRYDALLAKGKAESEISTDSLSKGVELAELQLERTTIRAPFKGTILKIFAHEGDTVGGGQPILRMGNTEDMIVIGEVYETDVSRVKEHDPVWIGGEAILDEGTREDAKRKKGEEQKKDLVQKQELERQRLAIEYPLRGEVIATGGIIAKNNVLDIDPTANADRRVVEVVIAVKKTDPDTDAEQYKKYFERAQKLINLQVTVRIWTEGTRPPPVTSSHP